MARSEVIDIDRGWNKLRDELKRTSELGHVKVGVLGEQAAADRGGITQAQLAAVHEFGATFEHPGGTPYMVGDDGRVVFLPKGDARATAVTKPHTITIPERSFIRSTIDENAQKYRELAKKLALLIVDGKLTAERALELFGERVVADIKLHIQRGIDPPLAAETVRRKGSSKPLIDTAQMINAITYQVEGT